MFFIEFRRIWLGYRMLRLVCIIILIFNLLYNFFSKISLLFWPFILIIGIVRWLQILKALIGPIINISLRVFLFKLGSFLVIFLCLRKFTIFLRMSRKIFIWINNYNRLFVFFKILGFSLWRYDRIDFIISRYFIIYLLWMSNHLGNIWTNIHLGFFILYRYRSLCIS